MAHTGRAGRLKVFLGAAPGVGKTYRMLDEGRRRADRGADVVVAFVECHHRPRTEEMLDGLEIVPRTRRGYRGADFPEMDLDAVLARAPEVALVDELAAHQRARRAAREALAGRGGAAAGRHRRGHHASTCSTLNRSTTWSSGSPASRSARRCPTRWSAAPTRSSWWTCPPRRCAAGWPTATSTRRRRSTRRSRTTSGSATSPRCGSWRCCGWPAGSTRPCSATGPSTASSGCGRPGSGWWSR